jgi:phosphatidylserine decarboxylase
MVRDGYFYGFGWLLIAGALVWLTGGWWWAIVPLLLTAFFLWFFRDPERVVPSGPGLVVSPADGVVTSVTAVSTPAGEKLNLSVFLSVFDVHVNRSPMAGVVRDIQYQKGLYLNALNPDSADKNEQNAVTVAGDGYEVVFKQIAGLLARRIVFKFGSRVDILLPGNASLAVTKGDRVKGGSSVLATIPQPVATAGPFVVAGETRI